MSARSELKVRLHSYAYGTTFLDVREDLLAAFDGLEALERLETAAEAFLRVADRDTDEANELRTALAQASYEPAATPASTCIETIGGDPDTAQRLSFQIKVF
jgi:hypothetical protein